MDMTWKSMLHEAAAASFEKDIKSFTEKRKGTFSVLLCTAVLLHGVCRKTNDFRRFI